MSDRSRDVERLAILRREAEKIVRELFQPEEPGALRLAADLLADGEEYVLEVELAGVRPSELAVYALGDSVIVEGTKRERRPPIAPRPVFERAERSYGAFRRVFDWPGPADVSRLTASLRAGLLIVRVPRITDRRGRPRPIQVTVDT